MVGVVVAVVVVVVVVVVAVVVVVVIKPPTKINKFSLLLPETGTGLDLLDRGQVAATLFGVLPVSGQRERTCALSPLPMAEEHG